MALLDILKYPDSILRQPTKLVESFDQELKILVDNMVETMYAADGIGLAAPQVGSSKRVAVLDISQDQKEPRHFINPKIISQSGKVPSEEGCLSIPEFRDTITRAEKIVVQAQDLKGVPFQLEAEGLLAICLQHEIDHLDGVLFVDRLSRLKREFFKRWYNKKVERGEYNAA